MKLVKIGSDSSCDIVLRSNYVSALHAELTIHDNGEITIEDKGSKNGTKIGDRRIEPGRPVRINRGQEVAFADVPLEWSRVPAQSQSNNLLGSYEIGKDGSADIKLTSQYASRFHATLKIGNDKKAYIEDNGSTNGTKVNGVAIPKHRSTHIKKGDRIVCGDEDITDIVDGYIPNPNKWVKTVCISACVIAVVALVAFVIVRFTPIAHQTVDPNDYRSAVVYVRSHYHFIAHFDDSPIPEDIWNGDIDMTEITGEMVGSQATAFFVDEQGRLATNRHVAVPWDYVSGEEISRQRAQIEHFWNGFIGVEPTTLTRYALSEKVLKYVVKAVVASQRRDKSKTALVFEYLQRLLSSKISIKGQLDYIAVGYSGRNYSDEREFDRCQVLCESGNKDIDIAILQLNNPKTPSSVKKVFSIDDIDEEELKPLEDQLYVIGYPNGLEWNLDENRRSLEPKLTETKCSTVPSKYSIELDKESVAGASGSPIFNKYGQLVAILYGGVSKGTTGSTLSCKAKYLKEMYKKEIKNK